jgi:plasmid stabilization system protein ParE
MRIDFAESFGERLRVLEAFMLAQDPDSAAARVDDLHEAILRFVDLVKLHPKIGRPAAGLAASSVEGQRRLARVLQLAARAGLPELREYVLHAHLVLYAHSDSRVLMLSVRHQRELGYAPDAG